MADNGRDRIKQVSLEGHKSREEVSDCLREDWPPSPTRRMLNELQSVKMSEVALTIGLFTHYVLLAFCVNLQNGLNKVKGRQRELFGLTPNAASPLGPFNYFLCIYNIRSKQSHPLNRSFTHYICTLYKISPDKT